MLEHWNTEVNMLRTEIVCWGNSAAQSGVSNVSKGKGSHVYFVNGLRYTRNWRLVNRHQWFKIVMLYFRNSHVHAHTRERTLYYTILYIYIYVLYYIMCILIFLGTLDNCGVHSCDFFPLTRESMRVIIVVPTPRVREVAMLRRCDPGIPYILLLPRLRIRIGCTSHGLWFMIEVSSRKQRITVQKGPTWPTWGSPSPRGCRGKNVESLLAAYDVLTEDPDEDLQMCPKIMNLPTWLTD